MRAFLLWLLLFQAAAWAVSVPVRVEIPSGAVLGVGASSDPPRTPAFVTDERTGLEIMDPGAPPVYFTAESSGTYRVEVPATGFLVFMVKAPDDRDVSGPVYVEAAGQPVLYADVVSLKRPCWRPPEPPPPPPCPGCEPPASVTQDCSSAQDRVLLVYYLRAQDLIGDDPPVGDRDRYEVLALSGTVNPEPLYAEGFVTDGDFHFYAVGTDSALYYRRWSNRPVSGRALFLGRRPLAWYARGVPAPDQDDLLTGRRFKSSDIHFLAQGGSSTVASAFAGEFLASEGELDREGTQAEIQMDQENGRLRIVFHPQDENGYPLPYGDLEAVCQPEGGGTLWYGPEGWRPDRYVFWNVSPFDLELPLPEDRPEKGLFSAGVFGLRLTSGTSEAETSVVLEPSLGASPPRLDNPDQKTLETSWAGDAFEPLVEETLFDLMGDLGAPGAFPRGEDETCAITPVRKVLGIYRSVFMADAVFGLLATCCTRSGDDVSCSAPSGIKDLLRIAFKQGAQEFVFIPDHERKISDQQTLVWGSVVLPTETAFTEARAYSVNGGSEARYGDFFFPRPEDRADLSPLAPYGVRLEKDGLIFVLETSAPQARIFVDTDGDRKDDFTVPLICDGWTCESLPVIPSEDFVFFFSVRDAQGNVPPGSAMRKLVHVKINGAQTLPATAAVNGDPLSGVGISFAWRPQSGQAQVYIAVHKEGRGTLWLFQDPYGAFKLSSQEKPYRTVDLDRGAFAATLPPLRLDPRDVFACRFYGSYTIYAYMKTLGGDLLGAAEKTCLVSP